VNTLSRHLVCAAIALGSSLSPLAFAQQTSTADGVFTQGQVNQGETAYNASCAACHDMKFYRDIWSYWEQRPLEGFWFRIVSEMPSDNPGSLLDSEYTNILAYILSELGYPAGTTELGPDNDMSDIIISKR